MRLDRFLAEMGCGTRSEVKQYCRKRMVTVNGEICTNPETKVDPDMDRVTLQGRELAYSRFFYYMLNKPAGVVSATEDPREKTVLNLLAGCEGRDLFPVGRLDKDTEGLLLITNDGALAHRLLSPKKHVDKVYFVKAAGHVTAEDAALFREGLDIGDEKLTLPAELVPADSVHDLLSDPFSGKENEEQTAELFSGRENEEQTAELFSGRDREKRMSANETDNDEAAAVSEMLVTLREGRFHQVKRMFEAIGKPVIYLKRLQMGSLTLDPALKPGEYRPLTREEIQDLLR